MEKACRQCRNPKTEIPEISGELKQLIGEFNFCYHCAESKRDQLFDDLISSFSKGQSELYEKMRKLSRYMDLCDIHLKAERDKKLL